MSRVIKW